MNPTVRKRDLVGTFDNKVYRQPVISMQIGK